MDPERAVADDIENNAPAPAQGIAPSDSRPATSGQEGEAGQAFFQMMSESFTQFPPVDKIRKYGAERFRATNDDDAEKAEFWIENTIRVFDKMSLTPEECIKCVVSLLRDAAYQWWKTPISAVPKERVTWDFFQSRMIVSEYEREFVRLSQYARECVSSEAIMCKRFEDGLNEDIRLLVRILEVKEFIVLVDRACKAEALGKDKREAESEARDMRKRF
ncbi:Sal-like protein 1 [Gossypium australe]|uniref:Sal-like protein 1 n=1 Tax=Gossypium australe TaxID=47621 RepID=A0A5B6VX32_9ROSI|nr:Sal-like protein 1 [Gossypium australe]